MHQSRQALHFEGRKYTHIMILFMAAPLRPWIDRRLSRVGYTEAPAFVVLSVLCSL